VRTTAELRQQCATLRLRLHLLHGRVLLRHLGHLHGSLCVRERRTSRLERAPDHGRSEGRDETRARRHTLRGAPSLSSAPIWRRRPERSRALRAAPAGRTEKALPRSGRRTGGPHGSASALRRQRRELGREARPDCLRGLGRHLRHLRLFRLLFGRTQHAHRLADEEDTLRDAHRHRGGLAADDNVKREPVVVFDLAARAHAFALTLALAFTLAISLEGGGGGSGGICRHERGSEGADSSSSSGRPLTSRDTVDKKVAVAWEELPMEQPCCKLGAEYALCVA
jgi:hypothetical protein